MDGDERCDRSGRLVFAMSSGTFKQRIEANIIAVLVPVMPDLEWLTASRQDIDARVAVLQSHSGLVSGASA